MIQTSTYFALLAEFNSASIELEKVSQKYFGLSKQEAARKANMKQLPIPAFRMGAQKSPWMVHAEDLANLIDAQRDKAKREFDKMNG
jgi:Pyocin activator protein PrtN